MDNKTLREMLGLGDDVPIDEEALKFMQKSLKDTMNIDDSGGQQELNPRDLEELKEKMRKQKELFDEAAKR